MSLLEMSFSGAVLVVVIMIIRALMLYHLPKKTFLVLWSIALIRLLVPYSVSSVFSIYTLFGSIFSQTEIKPLQTSISMIQPASVLITDATASEISTAGTAFPISSFYQFIWIAGVCFCALFFITAYLKNRRNFQEAVPVECSFAQDWLNEHQLVRKIQLKQTDKISAPLTYGVLNPVILLPKQISWDDQTILSYVLAHEYIHIRRFDAAIKIVLAAVLCIHWFNPAVWAMYILANRDLELCCDEAVIRLSGDKKKSAYARVLIDMEEKRSGLIPLYSNFSKQAIEKRILAIMKTKKTSWLSVLAAAVLVTGMALVFSTSRQPVIQEEGKNHAYSEDGVFSSQDDSSLNTDLDRNNAKLIANSKWFSEYEQYGLSYNEQQGLLFYHGQPVGFFHDETKPGVYIHVNFSQGTAEIEVKRNANWDIVGLVEYATAETDNIAQQKTLQETSVIEHDTVSTDLQEPEQRELLAEYGKFGISFNDSGHMLYQNKPVRWFADFIELDGGNLASRYVYRNDQGTENIRTVRAKILHNDGSTDPFGPLQKIVPWKIEESDDFDFLFKDDQIQQTLEAFADNSSENVQGLTFEQRFSKYKDFGLTYVEADDASGKGNVYLNNKRVSRFVDKAPDGSVFSFTSAKTGKITAQTEYDSLGNLTGIKEMTLEA